MSLIYFRIKWTYYSYVLNLLIAVSIVTTKGVKLDENVVDGSTTKFDNLLNKTTVAVHQRRPHSDRNISASRLGLFAALRNSNGSAVDDTVPQPSATGPESRYGLTYYAHPSLTKQNDDDEKSDASSSYGSTSRLSMRPSSTRNRDIFEKYQNNERDRYAGSDRFLTPQFVKFKNDIEMETEKTHLKGMRMSKDASRPAAAVVYERAKPRRENYWPAATTGDDSFQRPFYKEPGSSFDESDSRSFPHSYQRLSSSSSGPNEPYNFDDVSFPSGSFFKSNSNPSEFNAKNRRPYNFPSSFSSSSSSSFDDDRSTNDDDGGGGGGGRFRPNHRNFPSIPSSLSAFSKDFAGAQSPDDDEEEEEEEEEGEDNDGSGKDRKNKGKGKGRRGKKPKAKDDDFEDENRYTSDNYSPLTNTKSASNKYDRSYSFDNSDEVDGVAGPYGEKRRIGFHYGGGGGGSGSGGGQTKTPFSIRSATVNRNAKNKLQDADDSGFDSNYEITPDPFLADEHERESEEESEIPSGAPRGRIRQFSRQRAERLKPQTPTKRCVKKRKEMFTDDAFDEPDERMTCMICENLQTGGKYESCSYKTNPKTNNFAFENAAATYRSDGKNPTVYSKRGRGGGDDDDRFKRETAVGTTARARGLTPNIGSFYRRVKRTAIESESTSSAETDYAAAAPDTGIKSRTKDASISADESIPEGYSTFDDNDDELQDEELEEEDGEEMEEYKPQPPAYANEHSCKQVIRDGATCMVCRNPETNGKYEQCSYANEPENDYEYAQSTSYDKKGGDRFKRAVNLSELLEDDDDRTKMASAARTGVNATAANGGDDESFKIPDEWKDLRVVERNKIERANRIFKSLNRVKKEKPNTKFLFDIADDSYERQFLNLFPELSSGAEGSESILDELETSPLLDSKEGRSGGVGIGLLSKSGKSKFADGGGGGLLGGGNFKHGLRGSKSLLSDDDDDDNEEGSEMSKMMKEFKSKDRSACTKKMKDKMTCYVCNDKDGMKREECMYIMENEPKKATLSESAAAAAPDGNEAKLANPSKRETAANKMNEKYEPKKMTRVRTYKRERRMENNLSPSGNYLKTERAPKMSTEKNTMPAPQRIKRGKSITKKKRKDDEPEDDDNAAGDSVPEVDPQSPRGAFSDETKIIYDDKLGTSLPRFMVEKNEHEEEIDNFMEQL